MNKGGEQRTVGRLDHDALVSAGKCRDRAKRPIAHQVLAAFIATRNDSPRNGPISSDILQQVQRLLIVCLIGRHAYRHSGVTI